MDKYFRFSVLSLFLFFLLYALSCKKDEPAPTLPIVVIDDVNYISQTTAYVYVSVQADGGALINSIGICWNTSGNPFREDSQFTEESNNNNIKFFNSFSRTITQLTPNTICYVRAFATNTAGTSYSEQISFTTKQITVPVVATTSISSITETSAVSGGNVTFDHSGFVTEKGVCWGTETNPTIANSKTSNGSSIGNFSSLITGLTTNTTYYLRAYATNSAGTAYGNVISFKTRFGSRILFKQGIWYSLLTDIDDNLYKTITIGTQTWMAENLKTTKYNDGTAIPLVTDGNTWAHLSTPAYCWYENDEATYKSVFGALYNWYSVSTGKLCPTGWHVPNESEWTKLISYLGGKNEAGGKLKETGTTHWNSPNTGATNESGFTALPGGARYPDNFMDPDEYGKCKNNLSNCYFWQFSRGFYICMYYNDSQIYAFTQAQEEAGLSVRCIKDN